MRGCKVLAAGECRRMVRAKAPLRLGQRLLVNGDGFTDPARGLVNRCQVVARCDGARVVDAERLFTRFQGFLCLGNGGVRPAAGLVRDRQISNDLYAYAVQF